MKNDEEKELTDRQIRRQDLVDNAIYTMLETILEYRHKPIPWDIEIIGEIRDVVQRYYNLSLGESKEFYPYI